MKANLLVALCLMMSSAQAISDNQRKLYSLMSRSSLDDPESDRTVTTVEPNSAKEDKYREFLVQHKDHKEYRRGRGRPTDLMNIELFDDFE